MEVIDPDAGAANLPGYVLMAADQRLDTVFGDHVHDNNGTHLHGGVALNALWQKRWNRTVQLPTMRYRVPRGRVGRRFVKMLALELKGVRDRRWKSGRPLVFSAVVLQKLAQVQKACDIRDWLDRRMSY